MQPPFDQFRISMKKNSRIGALTLFLAFGLISNAATSFQKTDIQFEDPNDLSEMEKPGKKLNIVVGSKTFTATLSENETVEKFLLLLPLTVEMEDLNRNEKFYRLPKNLPTNSSNPGTIQTGDLMLWGANTLVIFYQTFSTSYPYTLLGKVNDPSGLAEALGAKKISITFQMAP